MTRFIRRVLGALSLDAATYEEIEADRTAWPGAALVVIFAGIGAGIGNAGIGDAAPPVIAVVAALSVLVWLAWATIVRQLGGQALAEPGTVVDFGQVLRTLGFAAAPGMFRAFEIFGGTRRIVLPLTALWMIAAMVVAIRQACDYRSLGRAIAVAVLGWVMLVAAGVVVGLWLTTPVS